MVILARIQVNQISSFTPLPFLKIFMQMLTCFSEAEHPQKYKSSRMQTYRIFTDVF